MNTTRLRQAGALAVLLCGAVVTSGAVRVDTFVWNGGRAATEPPTKSEMLEVLPEFRAGTSTYSWEMFYDLEGSGDLVLVASGGFQAGCGGGYEKDTKEAGTTDAHEVGGVIPWYAGAYSGTYSYAGSRGMCEMLETLPLIWTEREPGTWIEAGFPVPGMGHPGARSRKNVHGVGVSMNEIPIDSPARWRFNKTALEVVQNQGGEYVLRTVLDGQEIQRLIVRQR